MAKNVFPPEIFQLTAQHLGNPDLLNCALSNNDSYNMFVSEMWRNVNVFHFNLRQQLPDPATGTKGVVFGQRNLTGQLTVEQIGEDSDSDSDAEIPMNDTEFVLDEAGQQQAPSSSSSSGTGNDTLQLWRQDIEDIFQDQICPALERIVRQNSNLGPG
ncbi:hypothetical protein BGX28_004977 [Mortierella sp. GBA30]|nr:hypothetical protein BGX28_004977 [Mortierella sp. GBA30]